MTRRKADIGQARRALAALALLNAFASYGAPAATVQALYAFDGPKDGDGAPWSELVRQADGRFAGTTLSGGRQKLGSIYTTNLLGATRTLHSFTYKEGNDLNGPLVAMPDGSLVGTAYSGGATGSGTIFRVAADGTYTLLHTFEGDEGVNPGGGLLLASDGNFYGTATEGGDHGLGTVYRMTPEGVVTKLHDFGATDTDGEFPDGMLVETADHGLVGVTFTGGKANGGIVFRIGFDGSYATLADLGGPGRPADPHEGLVDGGDGWLYGTSEGGGSAGQGGTVYRLRPDGSGLTVLHAFTGPDGSMPQGRLCRGANGLLYGTTPQGGANDDGGVFQVDAAGTFALLHSFDGLDGYQPRAGWQEEAARRRAAWRRRLARRHLPCRIGVRHWPAATRFPRPTTPPEIVRCRRQLCCRGPMPGRLSVRCWSYSRRHPRTCDGP